MNKSNDRTIEPIRLVFWSGDVTYSDWFNLSFMIENVFVVGVGRSVILKTGKAAVSQSLYYNTQKEKT